MQSGFCDEFFGLFSWNVILSVGYTILESNQVLIVSFNVSDKNVFMYFVIAMVLWNVGGASICATIKIKSLRMSHISIN